MDNSRDVADRASMRHVDEVAGISYGHSIRYSDEKAKLARKEADKLACEAWTMRMLAYKGPAPSTLGDAPNAGYCYRGAVPRLRCASNRCAQHRAPAARQAMPARFIAMHTPFNDINNLITA
jgi:hypothetical protein